ncbi:MAG: hypothetical protein PVSMB11_08590 [Desulfuromonadaceae bacterium]
MKKIIIIGAFSLFAAGQAFAGNSITMDLATAGKQGRSLYGSKTAVAVTAGVPDDVTTLIGKTSNGVGLGAKTGPVGYAMIAQHKKGSKAFAASNDSVPVFYMDITAAQIGTPFLTVPTTSDATAFAAWTSM